ncbi:hypothetical protein Tco_1243692 [Tanacetum coccineum]
MGANGGVEGVNGNVERANGGAHDFSTSLPNNCRTSYLPCWLRSATAKPEKLLLDDSSHIGTLKKDEERISGALTERLLGKDSIKRLKKRGSAGNLASEMMSQFFSKIDLKSGTHQLREHRMTIPKTCVLETRDGHFEFTECPCGRQMHQKKLMEFLGTDKWIELGNTVVSMGKGLLGPSGGSGGTLEGSFGEHCGGNGRIGSSMFGVGEGKDESMGGMGGGSLARHLMVSNDGRGGGGLVVAGGRSLRELRKD